MNIEQAKEILLLYRPGMTDAGNPDFTAALELAKRDDALRRWLDSLMASHEKIRGEFKRIPTPEGLREQILSERPVAEAVWHRNLSWRQAATVAALILVVVGGVNLASRLRASFVARRFSAYSAQMVQSAQGLYGMNLETNDLKQIRMFLATRQVPADFALPFGLEKKTILGCVAQSWREHPVAMICFRSNTARQDSDLWLFVTDSGSFPDAPDTAKPRFASANHLPSAAWTAKGLTYLVALQGDVEHLKAILQ